MLNEQQRNEEMIEFCNKREMIKTGENADIYKIWVGDLNG